MAEPAEARDLAAVDARPAIPTYAGPRGAAELWARFANGVAVPVVRGRSRAYPGLPSSAPCTASFYRAFASAGPIGGLVIDAGCGAGAGSAILARQFDEVIAVDSDPRALAFVREHAGDVALLSSSFETPPGVVQADAAVVADVLGHVKNPALFLGSLRATLRSRARVLIAEPSVFVAQRLSQPARRAFSPRMLDALLVRGGFHATTWVADTGTFLACVATAADGDSWQHFASAETSRLTHPDVALAELSAAGRSGRRDVQREALLAEAELRMEHRDGDGAARAFLAAAALDPSDPRPHAGLSMLSLASGSLPDAVELAARAAELDPTEPTAAIALAQAADGVSPRDAFNAWRIAERLLPDDLGVASRLAALASARGDHAFGIGAFERLRAYGDPLPAEFNVTLARMLAAEGRHADALLELRVARSIDPHDTTVLELWSELESAAS